MSDIILKAENISKQYRLGTVGSGTLRDDFKRNWAKLRGKEDPFLNVGAVNDRSQKSTEDYVWALRDINFEVKQGEVLGIIGKNGAGKSTLLKILSRVTAPTTGVIKSRGRIASLLEVGTGFHPELTGRENIYLNGAILGMTKAEINTKLDEIIDFSGCERYIDTPTKRYSSGMTVRLAFAVAAHLEPEILVVDEVLAVGDAEFQKKAIGKMQDISRGEGRTVLFVSHNMESISVLSKRVVLLENGLIKEEGETDLIIGNYLKDDFINKRIVSYEPDGKGNENAKLYSAKIIQASDKENSNFDVAEDIFIEAVYETIGVNNNTTCVLHLINETNQTIFATNDFENPSWGAITSEKNNKYKVTCKIPKLLLQPGNYSILIALVSYSPKMIHFKEESILGFKIVNMSLLFDPKYNTGAKWPGIIRPKLQWNREKIS